MHARKTARDAIFASREDDAFFVPRRGDIVFRDSAAVRAFADRVNSVEGRRGDALLRPGELAAMALVHEVLHFVIRRYRESHPASFRRLAQRLEAAFGPRAREAALEFLGVFPPPAVFRALHGEGDALPREHLERMQRELPEGSAEDEINEELILLWVTNQNPAYEPVRTLVSDHELGPGYRAVVEESRRFFDDEPRFGPRGETLVDLLLAPSRAHPRSIADQLDFIDHAWSSSFRLDEVGLSRRAAWTQDLRTEEGKWFQRGGPGPGEPLLETMRFERKRDEEPAQFSPDLNWMPNVVLIAKSVYVWLDQLAKKYGREIERLDQVPDEELDLLAARGFNALWMIGLFERSVASRRVKQMRGDTNALASAYSLRAYEIAHELGGTAAYENLKVRAWARGIRLAADMVPNHVGIDGDWVIRHPDWFLQSKTPPYPNYRFAGPDLGEGGPVGLFLEEGYWDRSDAAVVFRRHDRRTGENRFVYHGNDGTSTPWNDTAQLDYLKAEVRRAVIDTILHVARMFPIIRFDAAMTLAKRHIQRLWYPLPGQGGAIPSRADYAMTQDEFDAAIPNEFWREVVDAVAEHAPDTLLLAEAFWMMEGYFVRTLGMHRVYNSAFMNMLKREENEKYRATIKNVLDFDPEILKRFVNFMNNPDEETARLQFGDEAKYFGVCVLMSTMPGLPMFGHGQIEGLREKYGMEYRRARSGEQPDEDVIRRHEREIVPLLHRRYLFSGVESFALYDFVTESGHVDEDVYAYSNGAANEHVLVIFHNRWRRTRGRIFASTHRGNLVEELALRRGLDRDPERVLAIARGDEYLVLRDLAHGLEFLHRTKDLLAEGLAWELEGFEYHVFAGFKPVLATAERPYDRLAAELDGDGVPDVEAAVRSLFLRPLHGPLREVCSKGHIAWLTKSLDVASDEPARVGLVERLGHVADGIEWLLTARDKVEVTIDREPVLDDAADRFGALYSAVSAAKTPAEIPPAPAVPSLEPEPAPAQEPAPAPTPEPAPAPEPAPTPAPAPETEHGAPSTEPAAEPAPAPEPAPAAEPAPAPAPSSSSSSSFSSSPPARPLSEPPASGVPDLSVLRVDLLLTLLQLEAILDFLDTALAATPAKPASQATATNPNISTNQKTQKTQAKPANGAKRERGISLALWARREALISEWELATPLVEGLATIVDETEARHRAALVLLAATLPSGPLAPAIRLALGTERGQTFLDVHDSDRTLWLNKERFEELARFLAEREAVSGRSSTLDAAAQASELAALAEREGYRVERIAAQLGPRPKIVE